LQSTSSLDVLQDALCFPLSFETQHSSIVHQDREKFSFFLLFSFVLDLLGRFWKKDIVYYETRSGEIHRYYFLFDHGVDLNFFSRVTDGDNVRTSYA